MSPRVTVLLTVYNGMPYLREAVESILGQSLASFAFLIIDNGSNDGTSELLRGYAARADARLDVRRLETTIPRACALNMGLDLVKTPYTAILDADDTALPQRLARQVAFLDSRPDVALVGSDILYVDARGKQTGRQCFPERHEDLLERMPVINQFAHAACCFRTDSVREAGGYPETYLYAYDMALWIELLARGKRVASIAEPLAAIRRHAGQQTLDPKLASIRQTDAHALAESFLRIPGISRRARQATRLRDATVLFRLGRKKAALVQFVRGLREDLWMLPFNPLLWRRAGHEVRQRVFCAR